MHVSILTPSFNQGRFIEGAILSVFNQRLYLPPSVNLNHIILDSGSTDNTVKILRHYEDLIEYNALGKKQGQAYVINKALSLNNSGIIACLNASDIYYSGAIAAVVNFFRANPDIDVVYGMADQIDEKNTMRRPYPSEPWNFDRLKEVCFICQPSLFLRKRVIEQYGVLDESLQFCRDYQYWLHLGKNGVRFAYLEKKLAGLRTFEEMTLA